MVQDQIVKDIICHLFASQKPDSDLDDLAEACARLESSMDRMMVVKPAMELLRENRGTDEAGEGRNPKAELDTHFDHSWVPGGPNPGWYWIPKRRLTMDIAYPANLSEVPRFGHLALKVRATCPPTGRLSNSFMAATMTNRDPGRLAGKRRQEDWME